MDWGVSRSTEKSSVFVLKMGRQAKPKKSENLGKGKVTPAQVAFIVDRYLIDNSYSQTRSLFRTEAAGLLSRSPVQQVPKSLLSLGAMLDEYICLKEQKVLVEQERVRLEQEKCRVDMLLQGMQGVMNVYNAALPPPVPIPVAAPNSSSGHLVYSTPTTMPVSLPSQPSNSKRKDMKAPETQQAAKKPCTRKMSKGNDGVSQSDNVTIRHNVGPNSSTIQGSSVVKCLFNQPVLSPPSNSSSPKTPPQAISPQPHEISPTRCTERLTMSPAKHVTYTVERNHSISISPAKTNLKRDVVKGRLDFDEQIVEKASTSESDQDFDIFDMDLANLDLFGEDFSFSELLVDLDMAHQGACYPTDNISGSSHEAGGADQLMSDFSATTKLISEDNNLQGPETTTIMKSITKCIRILSPAKRQRASLAEN